jgi:rfaE bifunctional protein nucleotidyltransferase chain/domain
MIFGSIGEVSQEVFNLGKVPCLEGAPPPVVGVTNGCYDLLHAGHVMSLQSARAHCDFLVVGVNVDAAVRTYKGPDRPVISLEDRMLVLDGLSCVDAVVPIGLDAIELLQNVRPNIYIKGGDTVKNFREKPYCTETGIEIWYTEVLGGRGTTQIIEQCRRLHGTYNEGHMKFVPKGWGYEHWLVNNDVYCGKKLFIHRGLRFSWHYHKVKHETFYVESGRCAVMHGNLDDIEVAAMSTLEAGDRMEIPPLLRHQVLALQDTVIIEISTHHEDSDSYRIQKGD